MDPVLYRKSARGYSRLLPVSTRAEAGISGGYGFGLAIVRQIMTLHRGSVTVNDSSLGGQSFYHVVSKAGRGKRFRDPAE
jgi:signal transduction histidine kinase